MAISISHLSDGRFVDVNDSFVRLLGHQDRHPIIGRTASELGMWVQSSERAKVLETLSEENAALHSIEAQVLRRDGRMRDVIMSVEVMAFDGAACVLTTMFDVTEYKEAESGIVVLKSFYENTLRELPIQVTVLDSEARFFYMNPEALRDEDLRLWMIGKTSIDYARAQGLAVAPYQRRHAWFLDVIARKEIGQIEETLTGFDGNERHVLSVATPVLDENDEVVYVVGYGMDITERKHFEQKLLEAKHAAEEMARLKSAFVANMSHEIRTPLTAILGFAAVLGEELAEEQREIVDIIKQSGEWLLETLNSVLDLARLEANALDIDPKLVDLTEEIQEATQLYRPMAERKGLAFHLDLPNHAVEAQLDRAFLHRVLSNLLSNAIKFTDTGEIRLRLTLIGSDVEIHVEDTGIGIGEDFLPHLFEEFKQESTGISRTHTGSGLGLAITRHLVERMHGQIRVESKRVRGSHFLVTLPILFSSRHSSPDMSVRELAQVYQPSEGAGF
jgi:PAS domain S-box-containing protein